MKKKLTFLGIETSCDETAASVVQENDEGTASVLSNIVSSQIKEHKKFGGIVPEIAARAHIENIDLILTNKDYFLEHYPEKTVWIPTAVPTIAKKYCGVGSKSEICSHII